MSLLNIPTLENATGEVKDIFEEIQSTFGMVPNGIRQWSASPKSLKMQWDKIKTVMSKDKGEQKLYAIIRYLASGENNCEYCIGFNGSMLINNYGINHAELMAMQSDPSTASLDEKNKALLLFAMKAIKNADSIDSDDISALKQLDISEENMFDIVQAASHMYVVNTIFKTFKVEND